MPNTNLGLLIIAAVNLAAFVVGIAGTVWFEQLSFLSFAVGVIAIVTFFGALALDVPASRELVGSDLRIRRAIAIAIVTVYLVLVAITAFFQTPAPLEGLLLNFTTTAGVVIAFYFGSSAYVEAKALALKREKGRGD